MFLGTCTAFGLLAAPAIAADATDVKLGEYLEPANASKYQVSLNLGLGGYLGQLSDYTNVGPVWGVNVDGNLTRGIGWELGYNGARNPLTDPRPGATLPTGEAAWRHGLTAMAKIYAPRMETIRPFAGIGLGAAYINVTDKAEGEFQNDYIAELPVGAGVELNTASGISAGVRALYRFQAGEEFAPHTAGGQSPEGGLLSAAFTLGGSF
jgi:opacity protein-like surface antigen